ncbi:MAG: hypothetical protein ACN6O3_04125 [Comamonas sp.]
MPSPQWMQLAAWLSGLLTLASCLLLWRLHRRGLWQAGEPWPSMGRVKRAFMLPLCLLLAYFCFWLGLAGTLPMAYTAVLGQPAIYPTLAERKRDSGRYSCNYQIKLRSIDYLFFEYCIGSERYGELPAHQQMPVLVQVKRSWFGDSVQSLRLAAP